MSRDESSCQSCGMPMAMDPQGGGSESDGTHSKLYCSHCYQDGRFTIPDLTAQQMQDRVRGKLQELKLPQSLIESSVAEIPQLQRWAS